MESRTVFQRAVRLLMDKRLGSQLTREDVMTLFARMSELQFRMRVMSRTTVRLLSLGLLLPTLAFGDATGDGAHKCAIENSEALDVVLRCSDVDAHICGVVSGTCTLARTNGVQFDFSSADTFPKKLKNGWVNCVGLPSKFESAIREARSGEKVLCIKWEGEPRAFLLPLDEWRARLR
jgi:hypothetical protein